MYQVEPWAFVKGASFRALEPGALAEIVEEGNNGFSGSGTILEIVMFLCISCYSYLGQMQEEI